MPPQHRQVRTATRRLVVQHARVRRTVDAILARCSALDAHLLPANGNNAAHVCMPARISMRSHVLMRGHGSCQACSPKQPQQHIAAASTRSPQGEGPDLSRQHALPTWQPPVDLNPGYSFAPGSPQQLVAAVPGFAEEVRNPVILGHSLHLLCHVHLLGSRIHLLDTHGPVTPMPLPMLQMTQLHARSCKAKQAEVQALTHRELLQAAIFQLQSEYYTALRDVPVAAIG
jgi:hypothetical protein